MKYYDVIIIGAGPGGIFSAYELSSLRPDLKIAVFEAGKPLEERKCPIDGDKIKNCVNCSSCAIMRGFGGAGAFSDGKYNITNDFGGTLYEHIGKEKALELMRYVDGINLSNGGVPVVVAGVPVRYIHAMSSITSYEDFENTAELVSILAKELTPDILEAF